jgi:hypothetical protein
MERRTAGSPASAVVAVRALYAELRHSASACTLEFMRWMQGPRSERAGARARYIAALEREDAAAGELNACLPIFARGEPS